MYATKSANPRIASLQIRIAVQNERIAELERRICVLQEFIEKNLLDRDARQARELLFNGKKE